MVTGKVMTLPRWAALTHLLNHQIHHRGQQTAPSNRLRGKAAVAAWWARALTAPALTVSPCLNLTAPATLTGTDTMVMLYRSGGRLRAQTFRFWPNGQVSHTAIHPLAPRAPEKPHDLQRS